MLSGSAYSKPGNIFCHRHSYSAPAKLSKFKGFARLANYIELLLKKISISLCSVILGVCPLNTKTKYLKVIGANN